MLGVCAAELRSRTGPLYTAMLECTIGAYAPPSDELRRAAKDWIAKSIAAESDDLGRFLWKPRSAFGEIGEPDTLAQDARREQEALFARVDTAFDRMQNAYAERIVRAVTRISLRAVRLLKFWS